MSGQIENVAEHELRQDFDRMLGGVRATVQALESLKITESNVMLKLPLIVSQLKRGDGLFGQITAMVKLYNEMEEKYGRG